MDTTSTFAYGSEADITPDLLKGIALIGKLDSSIPHTLEVGPVTLDKIKGLPKSENYNSSFFGIPVILNEILPPDGYVFLDKNRKVLGMGTLSANMKGKST